MNFVFKVVVSSFLFLSFILSGPPPSSAQDDLRKTVESPSFANEVRPILATNCFGCHQGAIDRGGYVMTNFESMVAGGDSDEPTIVPGKPDESRLVEVITSHDGEAEMPPSGTPLSAEQVELIRKWIESGAKNDYTKNLTSFSSANPPSYSRAPVLTSMDFSPDGKLLAVTGFNEVLIIETPDLGTFEAKNEPTAGKIVSRLIGISSRIESVKFSPDGKRLAVSGGSPGEFGEVQVWDLEKNSLALSKVVSFDTISGVNWTPDGKLISFGCTDTTLRAIDSTSGEQVLFQGAHEDWIRDTVFSVDGSRIVSVGRDMSCKLTEVTTQRFVDNITSITPGVLKGGIASVDRHPSRDEIVIGGADGIPKVYRMDRLTVRKIGDDANLIRQMPAMPGRVNAVSVSDDGKRIVAGSSLDGAGFVHVYSYEFDTTMPDNIKAIVSKVAGSQNAEEKKALADYIVKDVKQICDVGFESNSVYSVEFHPQGKFLVCGGSDGLIRFVETESGKLLGSVVPVSVNQELKDANIATWKFEASHKASHSDALVATKSKLESLRVSPAEIEFTKPTDYAQFVVQAVYEDGTILDVTDHAKLVSGSEIELDGPFAQAAQTGSGEIKVTFGELNSSIATSVELGKGEFQPDFVHDVNPVLSKLGCNAGTCHGSQGGKKGFKLSLRGTIRFTTFVRLPTTWVRVESILLRQKRV